MAAEADHRQPRARRRCARRGRASTSRSRWRCSRRPGRSRRSGSRGMRPSASWRSTGACGRSRGALAVAEGARRAGLERILCAAESAPRGGARRRRAGPGPPPRRGGRLSARRAASRRRASRRDDEPGAAEQPDLADVRGQERARRALEIAAAGGHNLLLAGPPGTGKTMLARRLPAILPPLDTRRGARGHADPLGRGHAPARAAADRRSRRSARRTTARRRAAIVGGGAGPAAGRGEPRAPRRAAARRAARVRAACARGAPPAARGRRRRVARVGGQAPSSRRASSSSATMNLCPCGARGDPAAECSCSPQRLAAFRDKLSRALLDRFDLVVDGAAPACRRARGGPGEPSAAVRERVVAARERLRGAPLRRTADGRRAARPRRRAAAALWARSRARRAGGADDRRRSPAPTRCCRSTWPRRSPTGRRRSCARERARARRVRGGERRAPGRRAAQRALRAFGRRSTRARSSSGCAARASAGSARSDAAFPPLLRAIHDPPPGLFLRGDAEPELLARPAVAVVGARACSPYGAQVARQARAGARRGRARRRQRPGAWRRRRGAPRRTRGAAGQPSPCSAAGSTATTRRRTASSRGRIAAAGLVVSEYAPGVEPAPWRFPARNRIVAGLCAATVVVEARERSGALITADFALEEGREVFAVPGEITSALSAGSNALLRLGATPLTRSRRTCSRASASIAAEPAAARARARRRARCSRAFASAPPVPTSSRGRPGSTPASSRPRSPSSSSPALVAEEEGIYRRVRLASRVVADSYWLDEPTPLLASRPLAGPPDVEIVGGGDHGLLVRAHARAGGTARAPARGARDRRPARAGGTAASRSAAARCAYDGAREWLGPSAAADSGG